MTTYIAGPMTGYPDYNYPLFRKVAAELRAAGIDVRDPTELHGDDDTGGDHPWDWYLRHSIRALMDCDHIVLLPGWQASRGACLEWRIAGALGMHIHEYQPHDATQPESEATH